jgi:hypothetical protein
MQTKSIAAQQAYVMRVIPAAQIEAAPIARKTKKRTFSRVFIVLAYFRILDRRFGKD